MTTECRERILLVWDPSRHSAEAHGTLIAETRGRPASVELVAANRPRILLSSLALSTGLVPDTADTLEAEGIADLEQEMRAFIARLPKNLGIRSRVQTGEPEQIAATLLEHNVYDLVVVVGPSRIPLRRRALARRLAGISDLLFVPAGRTEAMARGL